MEILEFSGNILEFKAEKIKISTNKFLVLHGSLNSYHYLFTKFLCFFKDIDYIISKKQKTENTEEYVKKVFCKILHEFINYRFIDQSQKCCSFNLKYKDWEIIYQEKNDVFIINENFKQYLNNKQNKNTDSKILLLTDENTYFTENYNNHNKYFDELESYAYYTDLTEPIISFLSKNKNEERYIFLKNPEHVLDSVFHIPFVKFIIKLLSYNQNQKLNIVIATKSLYLNYLIHLAIQLLEEKNKEFLNVIDSYYIHSTNFTKINNYSKLNEELLKRLFIEDYLLREKEKAKVSSFILENQMKN